MATQGTEKYYRINLFLDKGCIKLTRALIQKHVDNYTLLCHTPSSWPLEDFIRHNQRSIFHFPNGKKRNNLMEEYKQLLVPLAPNKPNIDDWDLPLRCFVLREICDLSLLPQHKADIKVIKKIRNKLCHTTDPSLSDTEYVDYSQQLKDVIGRFLTWLKDANVAKEVYDIIKDIEDGPLTHLQTLVRQVEDWQKSDQAIAAAMNNLELKTTEGFAVQSENFKAIMEKTQQLLDLYTKGQPFQPPGTKITMNVLNCDTNTEDFLCSKLVDIFMKERAGNESEEQLPRLIKEALSKLLNENVELIKAKKECVAIYLRCKSFESLKHLWTSCVNGEITQMFKPVEQCLREMPGCENVELEVILTEDEVLRCVEKMGHQIKSSVTMATLLPSLYKPGYRNWVKGCTALKFARDGMENFVDRNIHQFHQDVLANILADSQCSSCTMENIMPCKYDSNFCRYSEHNCKTHDPNDPMKTSRPCPNSVCNKIRNEIERKHRLHDPSWRNTDSSRWCDEPWQLATCYMPVGYAASTSASQTDLAGLLSIITNNTVFDTVVEDDLTSHNNVFCKAREVRNDILHMEDMRITDTELADYIQTLQTMLSNPKCSTTDFDIQNAKTRLTEIQNGSLFVTTKDETEIREDALRVIDDKKQDALSAVTTHNYIPLAAFKTAKVSAEGAVESKQQEHAEMSNKQITEEVGIEIQTVFDQKKLESFTAVASQEVVSIKAVTPQEDQSVKDLKKTGVETVGKYVTSIKKTADDAYSKTKKVFEGKKREALLDISSSVAAVNKAKVETVDAVEGEQKFADLFKNQIEKDACRETQSVFDEKNWERLSQEVDTIKDVTSREDQYVEDVNIAGIEIVENDEMSIKQTADDTYIKSKKALKKQLLSVYQDGEQLSTSLGQVATDEYKHIDELYVTPNMKDDGKPVKSYKDILKQKNKKIYIVGEAGTGKTSLCQKMVSTWCKINTTQLEDKSESQQAMTQFDYLFYISLRDVITDNTIEEMIIHHLLPNKPSLHEPLSRVLEEENCLIILDGLDEWTTENNTAASVNRGLPGRDAVRNCTVLTTTRPWKLETLHLKSSHIDMKIELLGIDKTSSEELIQSMINHLNDKFHCQKTYKNYISDIKDKKLDKLTTIPVILKQIVCLWHAGKKLGKSKSDIYCRMWKLLLELAQKRLINDSFFQLKKEEWMKSSIKLPACFDDNETCQYFKPLLFALAELAFHTLLSEDQESSLVFKSTKAGCYNLSREEVNICLKIGILSQNKILIDCTSQFKIISFLHKTYQEYLAAMYVSLNQSETKQCLEKLQQFCSTEEKCINMLNVVTFISGLCPSDITCTLLDHYYTKVGLYKRQHIMIDCMREGWTCPHDNKHLYCAFIEIREPSEYLDQLCQVNIPNITWLEIHSPPTAPCLQHLLQIHTLKRLVIYFSSDSPTISEDDLYTLVHHHRHTLNNIDIVGMTLRSNTRLSTLIPQIQHLWGLYMYEPTLPQQLVTSLRALHSQDRRVGIHIPTILPDTESTD